MPYTILSGDLLEATTEYIVQQNCCTALKAQGLSAAIAAKWPSINPYAERRRYKGSWAVAEDRPEPGSIVVYEFDKPTPLKGVVCAFAQVSHGKPGAYKDPLGLDTHDSHADRERYFQSCLDCLAELRPASVGFPYRVGSGLAGGSWPAYEGMLRRWSAAHPEIDVRVYKLP